MAQLLFDETLEAIAGWRRQPEVLGVVQVGSKSRGHGDETSDDDLEIVVTEEAYAARSPSECIEVRLNRDGRPIWDAQWIPLSALERKTRSTIDLDRWPYEHAPVVFDRDGLVGAVVVRLGAMPAEFRQARILHGALDAGVNARRAQKARERLQEAAACALIAQAARGLTRVAFALEHRWAPLEHWLEKELATLSDPDRAGEGVEHALRFADPVPILEALERLEPRLIAEGFPADRPGRQALFAALIHPSRAAERAVHGLIH